VIITIDGPSGAGKGTVATYLALRYNLHQLDTGLLYRALAASMVERGIDESAQGEIINLAKDITIADTRRDGLKTETVAALASKVAAIPEVREILNRVQRDFAYAEHPGYRGVILDGRDVGTVICPDAPCKIYLTACQDIRAIRRMKEEGETSPHVVEKMMAERDKRDANRQVAPLNAAPDAFIIDTSHLTVAEVCERAAHYIENFCLSSPKLRKSE
jgi:cytidylate kinase